MNSNDPATNTTSEPIRNATEICMELGGTPTQVLGCICPAGLTSPYDSAITLNYCSIPTEYSPLDISNGSSVNSNRTTSSPDGDASITITFFGVIQLIALLAASVMFVSIVKRFSLVCSRDVQNEWPKSTNSLQKWCSIFKHVFMSSLSLSNNDILSPSPSIRA